MVSKVIFWKNYIEISIEKIKKKFLERFSFKIKGGFYFFYKRFPWKKLRKFFIGDFHVKLKVSFEVFTRDFPRKKIIWKKFLNGFLLKIDAEGKFIT